MKLIFNHLCKTVSVFVLLLVISSQTVQAQATMKSKIEQVVSNSPLSKTAIVSVSVRKASTGQLVYQRYGNLLLHTASCLKALSTAIVLEIMGINGSVSTDIYKSADNIYIKLSGDPLLNTNDLDDLIYDLKSKGINSIKGNIIIDDSIIDDTPWGVGWMWDDENSPLMPKVSAYNLDQNVVTVKVTPNGSVQVIPAYPVKIVRDSNAKPFKVERRPWIDPETIFISGKVNKVVQKSIPVGSPENYFKAMLLNSIKSNGISFSGKVLNGKIPVGAELLASKNRAILELISFTNQKSNNLAAESLFKIAGAKYNKVTGTTANALKAFDNYYSSWGTSPSAQEIVDASGVSHNDLLQTNWITSALAKIYKRPWFDQYKNALAQPGVRGTLKHRLSALKGKLWAKTGTNAGISGLSGYIKAKSGNVFVFSILVQNFKGSSSKAKQLENQIVNTIYHY